MINILLISIIMVFIIDLSGIIDEMEHALAKWLNKKEVHIPKPWSCSLCTSFWTGLLYLILTNTFTIPTITYVCMIAFLTPVTNAFLTLLKNIMIKAINIIYSLFNL